MDANICVSCGEIIPEGRLVCWKCEQKEIRIGTILQSNNTTAEEVENAYNWLYANIDDMIDIC
jgi:hypothetical protein